MKARMFFLAGSLLLIGVFFAPLWTITLEAAQFPGGLKMHIWINQITGSSKHIIQNVNILNHYIGMKPIHPDSIPELQYFPYFAWGFIGTGILGTLLNNKWYYAFWVILLIAGGTFGIYDFYLWLYDYGHNLDPDAPIKIPGMTYMPPLLGEKDLLNFYVKSYPSFGTLFLTLSGGLAGYAALLSFKKKKRRRYG